MPRALGCFQKLGFEVQPFPAHFMAKRSNQKPKNIFIPDDKALYTWRVIFKEWIGCVVYRLSGYM